MLIPEYVSRYRNLPFYMEFTNVKEEPPHLHRELEIAFVLRGNVTYRIFNQDFSASRGEMIIIETEDLHYIWNSSDDLIMIKTYIDLEYFADQYPYIDYMVFACEYNDDDDAVTHQRLKNKVAVFKTYLSELMYMTLSENADDNTVRRQLDTILSTMIEHFQGFHFDNHVFKTFHDPASLKNLQKLYKIYKYIYQNYESRITLQDIADETDLSPFYISHLVKETAGLSLQELLNYTRVEFAEKYLVEDALSLTQISEFSGFSSPAYFKRCFTEWLGMSPSEYKKKTRPKERIFHCELDHNECLRILREYVQNPIDFTSSNRTELHKIINNLSDDNLQLMLQLARKLV